jgi:PTS system fructose-specific IID component
MLWRSFLLQSVWNPRGMQSVGFCFIMLPVLRKRGLEGEAAAAFLKRHLGFFNTNPVLVSYVAGAAAAAELAGREDEVADMKRGLAGPLGMAGDSLLWGAVRPLAGFLGVSLALLGRTWAPLGLLVLYNAPHLSLRVRGFSVGARLGPSGAAELLGQGVRRIVAWIRGGVVLIAGFVLAVAVSGKGTVVPWKLVVAGAFFAMAYAAARLRVPTTVVGVAGVLGGLILMITGNHGG